MSDSSHSIALTGLDALDPLAYLAALGCLAAVTEHCRATQQPDPKLRFDLGVRLRPTLIGPFADDQVLLDWLVADLDEIAGRGTAERDAMLAFDYEVKGKAVHDLKPPPDDFRDYWQPKLSETPPPPRRTLDWAAAMLTDVAKDNNQNCKPFALHFTAGQQRFLAIALELLDGLSSKPKEGPVDREAIAAAMFGPWPESSKLKVFGWSPKQERAYAHRALDPSEDKKLGTPGADWLALRGIALLSSAPQGTSIVTSGVRGSWKRATFSYPVWSLELDEDAVRSLLRHPAMRDPPSAEERKQPKQLKQLGRVRYTLPRGVEVLTCRISRSDQGGYGSFSRPLRR